MSPLLSDCIGLMLNSLRAFRTPEYTPIQLNIQIEPFLSMNRITLLAYDSTGYKCRMRIIGVVSPVCLCVYPRVSV
jgi:hypothetical protein